VTGRKGSPLISDRNVSCLSLFSVASRIGAASISVPRLEGAGHGPSGCAVAAFEFQRKGP
jgi:hypothetical protein